MATLHADHNQLQNEGKISTKTPFLQWLKVTTTKTMMKRKPFLAHSTEYQPAK